MAKNLKIILSDSTGKRIDQRLLTAGTGIDGIYTTPIYELTTPDGSVIELVAPSSPLGFSYDLMINWSSSEAAPAEQIQRNLIRQTCNPEEFSRTFSSMKTAKSDRPAELRIRQFRFYVNAAPGEPEPEVKGPFIIEPGKPWKLSFEIAKKPAAVVGIGADGVCVRSPAFVPANSELERKFPGRVFVEIAPSLSPSEYAWLVADDAESFRRVALSRLDVQGLSAGALRFGGKLSGLFRLHNFGIASAVAIKNAVNCWRDVVAFECGHGRPCFDDGAERSGVIDGKTILLAPSSLWSNGLRSWRSSFVPQIAEVTCLPVFRLAIKQGCGEKAFHALLEIDQIYGAEGIGDKVREFWAEAENEVVAESAGSDSVSRRESI